MLLNNRSGFFSLSLLLLLNRVVVECGVFVPVRYAIFVAASSPFSSAIVVPIVLHFPIQVTPTSTTMTTSAAVVRTPPLVLVVGPHLADLRGRGAA